ncbi:hypothetical protein CJ030_MR8G016491 [Morella rubra]|uniref:Uncharacterized protein n=1 Tax=Morella rubra TaxID=262757 RepID=A0A6A1UT80_9ROSI|nr:hypothetical protein CJ030_MR8G016483 [Morella rubra]KAB1203346.1 hypothetical protein CJ030_MR8G016491 [Morella rubra]
MSPRQGLWARMSLTLGAFDPVDDGRLADCRSDPVVERAFAGCACASVPIATPRFQALEVGTSSTQSVVLEVGTKVSPLTATPISACVFAPISCPLPNSGTCKESRDPSSVQVLPVMLSESSVAGTALVDARAPRVEDSTEQEVWLKGLVEVVGGVSSKELDVAYQR